MQHTDSVNSIMRIQCTQSNFSIQHSSSLSPLFSVPHERFSQPQQPLKLKLLQFLDLEALLRNQLAVIFSRCSLRFQQRIPLRTGRCLRKRQVIDTYFYLCISTHFNRIYKPTSLPRPLINIYIEIH